MAIHDLNLLFDLSNKDLADIVATGPDSYHCKKFMELGKNKHRDELEQIEFEIFTHVFEDYAKYKRIAMEILKSRNGRK